MSAFCVQSLDDSLRLFRSRCQLAKKYVGKVPFLPFESMIGRAVKMLREAVLIKAGFDFGEFEVGR
jgi:hypothetical protein